MSATGPRANRRKLFGFSLLEIAIAVAIIGLLLVIAIPTLQSLTHAELRSEAKQMQGLMRELYGRAIFSGTTHRLVFDLDEQTQIVEASEEDVVLERLDAKDIEEAKEDEDEREKPQIDAQFKPVEDEMGKKKALPSSLRVDQIWTDQIQGWIKKGRIAIYFFPGGYTQKAYVQLVETEDTKNKLTIVLQPLTGQTTIEPGEVSVSEKE